MNFWIFMLIMILLIPITMMGFGKYFMNKAPKDINATFGYRTSMSMKNKDTWEFAHEYCGNLWFKGGVILLPISVISMLFVLNQNKDIIGTMGAIVCFIQIMPLVGVIVPTEKALHRSFDNNGNRR